MVHIRGEILINRPVETVFDFVADERNEPLYNPNLFRVRKITEEAIGLGTHFAAETKSMGRTAEMIIEIISCDRPRKLETSTHMSNMEIRGTLNFNPIADGTCMQWSWDVQPLGGLKLVAPLIRSLGIRQEKRIWNNLKHFLEAQKDINN